MGFQLAKIFPLLSFIVIQHANAKHGVTFMRNSDNSRLVPLQSSSPFTNSGSTESDKSISMAVYYEVLCPDSIRFLQNQLLPLFEVPQNSSFNRENVDFDSLLDIQLIPYGKALILEKPETPEKYAFLCQHGPMECEGNKLHSCALHAIQKQMSPSPESTQIPIPMTKTGVINFLLCTMKYLITPRPSSTSLEGIGLNNLTSFSEAALNVCYSELIWSNSTRLKEEIASCLHEDGEGAYLLKKNGDLTKSLKPPLYFVPWITFNGLWTKINLEQSQKDVKKVLCSLLSPKTLNFYKALGCEKYLEGGIKSHVEKLDGYKKNKSVLNINRNDGGIGEVPDRADGHRGGRGVGLSPQNRRVLRVGPSPFLSVSPRTDAVPVSRRDRRRFLHANNDMGLSQGGTAWRWRTNVHANPRVDWKWRPTSSNPTLIH